MRFKGVSDEGVLAKRVEDVIQKMENGEETGLVHEPLAVRVAVKRIIEEGEITKAEEERLRRARIVALMVAEDTEVAVEGIKLSQKEHGVGNAPQVMQQFNFTETPEKMARLMEEEENENPGATATADSN